MYSQFKILSCCEATAFHAPTPSQAKQPPPAATGGSETSTDKIPGKEGGEVKPKKKEKVDIIIVCEYTQSVQRAPTVT